MKVLPRVIAFLIVKILRILRRAWNLNETFSHRFSMYFYKFQLVINDNSKQFNLFGVNFFPLIFKSKEVFCLSPRILNWNLLEFDFRELASYQLSTFSRLYLSSEKIVSSTLYNVLSSTNFQTSDFTTLRSKSLICT